MVKSPVAMTPALRKYFQEVARKGGLKRWQNASKKERSEHGAMMARARWGKKAGETA